METPTHGYPMKHYALAFNAALMPMALREAPLGVLTVGVEVVGYPAAILSAEANATGAVHFTSKLVRYEGYILHAK